MLKQLSIATVSALALTLGASFSQSSVANAALITFDNLITGQTSYGFDGDGDGINDVMFSTTDPYGFNTVGPGSYQNYINEPGLEGTSLLAPDLKVNFLVGAKDFLKFGFALDSFSESPNTYTSFKVFDSSNNLLASSTVYGLYSPSSFPEGLINVNFSGTASYALFDFSSDMGRYIIDNFEGKYGTTEAIPEPSSMLGLLALGGLGLTSLKRKQH